MIKIVLHCLPTELDQVMWIVDQLKRSSLFIDPKNFILDFTLNVSDNDIDWDNSILDKEYCIEKFNLIFHKSPFINDHKVSYEQTGCNTVRRNSIRKQDNTTHVDFTSVNEELNKLGIKKIFDISQYELLKKLGIENLIDDLENQYINNKINKKVYQQNLNAIYF